MLSQIGKVGGGGGALGAFSERFAWTNIDLPFSLFAQGNKGETSRDMNEIGARRWMQTARHALRRTAKKDET